MPCEPLVGKSTSPIVNLPISGAQNFIVRLVLLSQVLKLTHLPQTLTIHLMRFSTRNSRTEKICHSVYFPQCLDFSQVLATEEELGDTKEQVRLAIRPSVISADSVLLG